MAESPVRQRNTRQREFLKALLKSASRPLSVDEAFDLAKAEIPSLGLRTVYRNIRELEKEKQVIAIHYPGQPIRYEWVTGQHRPHFICVRCRRTFALDQESPEIAVGNPGPFEIQSSEVIFYGHCHQPDCDPGTGTR